MPGPMKPHEVRKAKAAILPEELFAVVNRLIAESWDGLAATLKQKDVISALVVALAIKRETVFERHLLDFEEAYRDAGWNVGYDKPGFNETYEATFTFTKRMTRPGEVGDEDG